FLSCRLVSSFSVFSFTCTRLSSLFSFFFGIRRRGKLRLTKKSWDSAFSGQTQKRAQTRSDGLNVILCIDVR
ncbi:hypothetical protein CCMA1212_000519, partial [Trichoderma ghanense]